jgi:hypothetical protein
VVPLDAAVDEPVAEPVDDADAAAAAVLVLLLEPLLLELPQPAAISAVTATAARVA